MRRFVVLGHDVPVTPDVPLDDLPGGAGRLDVLCRCVVAALLRSHGVRSDASIVTVHRDELAIEFDGAAIRHLHPDERSTAARFRDALAAGQEAVGAMAVEADPGITAARRDLAGVLESEPAGADLVLLDPAGDPVTDLPADRSYTFVLSDHHPFTESDLEVLRPAVDRRVSLGPVAIHADQAITVTHNYLDTDGYRTYAG